MSRLPSTSQVLARVGANGGLCVHSLKQGAFLVWHTKVLELPGEGCNPFSPAHPGAYPALNKKSKKKRGEKSGIGVFIFLGQNPMHIFICKTPSTKQEPQNILRTARGPRGQTGKPSRGQNVNPPSSALPPGTRVSPSSPYHHALLLQRFGQPPRPLGLLPKDRLEVLDLLLPLPCRCRLPAGVRVEGGEGR